MEPAEPLNTSVLINSPDIAMAANARTRLHGCGIHAATCRPGLEFLEAARRRRPEVAVLDAVDERVDATQMEMELLRELRPDVRIIVVSRSPSKQDAWVVERGVFFYMTAPTVTELVRVVQAAVRPPASASKAYHGRWRVN